MKSKARQVVRNQGQVFHDIETMTPELAKSYLENAAVNRSLSEPAIKRYAAAMSKGQWSLSQPIIFDGYGRLIDGQHRLMAVIRSGQRVQFNVLRGVASIRHMDAGRARKPADVLKMSGYKNANTLAAITRAIMITESDPTTAPIASGTKGADITIDDIVDRVEKDPALQVVAAQVTGRDRPLTRMMKSSAVAGWFIYTVSKNIEDEDVLIDFLDQAQGRVPGTDQNPAIVLYRVLNTDRTEQRRLSKLERVALLVKAWNAFYETRPVKKLFWRGFGARAEKFPVLSLDNEIGGSK